ncbi:MAG: DUF2219 family protein, partial [Moraxellaceae bacterium]
MNGFTDAKEYALVHPAFPIYDDQPRAIFDPLVSSTRPLIRDEQLSACANRLGYLRIVLLQVFMVSLLISFSHFARADSVDYLAEKPQPQWLQLASLIDEEKRPVISANAKKVNTSWALAFDNDLLAPGHRDRDYTYGMNLTYSGTSAVDADISLKAPLAVIDEWFGADHLITKAMHNYSVEAGLYGFTPKELERTAVDESDRPYASLVYFSSSHEQIDTEQNLAWNTTLTIGVLGLGLVGDLQNSTHQKTESRGARGWNHQISDGGGRHASDP